SGADQAFSGPGDHIAAFDIDLGSKGRQAIDDEIAGPGTDGASSRQRYAGFADTGEERPDDPKARPHLGDEFIGRDRVDNAAGREMDRAGIALVLILAPAVDRIIDAMIAEDADQLFDIRQMRYVFQRQRVVGQQRRDHKRQGGIFRSRNRYGTVQDVAAADADRKSVV